MSHNFLPMKRIVHLAFTAALVLSFNYSIAQCPQDSVQITFTTDNFGNETTWAIFDENNVRVYTGGPYQNNTTYSFSLCIDTSKCYLFVIHDAFGDGMCCFYGNGGFSVS